MFKSTYASKSTKDKQAILARRKATNLDKYGVDNVSHSQTVKDKIGAWHKEHAEEVQAKIRQTSLERYGVESTNSLPEVKAKKKAVFQERYGVDHQLKIDSVRASVAAKNKANAPERLVKTINTNLERYGVRNVSQVYEYHEKKSKSRFKYKDYTMPSGKVVRVQGYEDRALDELLLTHCEEEIAVHGDSVPVIKYTGLDGKEHTYFPDIFIPTKNLIIEVKSTYTFDGQTEWYETNLLKEQATKDAGYNFKFMIL